MASSDLPPRFPCWCQATYSWGGETKKDLGFIEGDLIEALNAGDGSWWMGRLRRDPRAVGLFPSNFVKVLNQGFQPAPNNRNASPLQPPSSRTNSGRNSTFRKPFQAYEKLGPRGSLDNSREATPESDREKKKKEKTKFRPYSSMKTAQAPMSTLQKQASISIATPPRDDRPRIPDPLPRRGSRAQSPQVEANQQRHSPIPVSDSRQHRSESFREPQYTRHHHPTSTSPVPVALPRSPQSAQYYHAPANRAPLTPSRHHSPYEHSNYAPDTYSPEPILPHEAGAYADDHYDNGHAGSSPPPLPPAHRSAFQPSRAPSPQPIPQHRTASTSHSTGDRMTPSPLRDAMNDVMMSLQDMSMSPQNHHSRSPSPLPNLREAGEVWSPDAFEIVRSRSIAEHRASSAQEYARSSQEERRNSWLVDETSQDHDYGHANHERHSTEPAPPQIGNFVQRMESQLHRNASQASSLASDRPPEPPLKGSQFSHSMSSKQNHENQPYEEPLLPVLPQQTKLRHRKSAYELGDSHNSVNRMYSTKTNVTNSTNSSSATHSSNSTQLTSRSIMSGYSAGGFSATSAGSLARRKFEPMTDLSHYRGINVADRRSMIDLSHKPMAEDDNDAMSGPSYHESHATNYQDNASPAVDWTKDSTDSPGVFGGMVAPKARKSGFFRKMIDSARSTARTGAASARSTLGHGSSSRPGSRAGSVSPTKSILGFGGGGVTNSPGPVSRPTSAHSNAARDMGLGGGPMGGEWMQVRRDINRSNTLSRKEREERIERCELHDQSPLMPIELLKEFAEGDEGLDGLPIEEPVEFGSVNLQLVDKSARFIQNLTPMITASSLAQSYLCRPHRSDVQRLRAIFTWTAERITWEDDYEGDVDTRRVIQTRRGCSEEIAVLVREMCLAVGLHAEAVRGYLKAPGENLELDMIARPNHWWNAVIVDGEWRIMDCALASPTHPRRAAYSCASSQAAESWYFLARPLEICYSHIPLLPEQQHIVPPIDHAILAALPCAVPAYFRHGLELQAFNTGLLQLENLEMAHLHVSVPEDVECIAEVEARAFAQDNDGDYFESGEMLKTKAFSQAEWVDGRKRFTIKAVLPSDDGQGILKVYAGKRGLMHSIRDNPHALAFAVPLTHAGQNPPYDFHIRHPTPHAQRHDLYVVQPQCLKLVLNNTFVFCVRQHPSSLSRPTPDGANSFNKSGPGGFAARPTSPNPYARPSSALSMASGTISLTGSVYSDPSSTSGSGGAGFSSKPAKLAIQTPSQKIIRLTRKQEHHHSMSQNSADGFADAGNGSGGGVGMTTSWETVVKIGERGTWRGLVLADRSARWCVFAEWECT